MLLALLAYAAVLHWTFQHEIAPVFAYLGARYAAPDPLNYVLVALALAIVALTLPGRIGTPADWMTWVLFIVVGIPAALIPQYSQILDRGPALVLGLVVSGVFLALSLLGRAGPGRASGLRLRVPMTLVWVAVAGFSLVTYAWVGATSGLALVSFDVTRIADMRAAYRDELAAGPLLGYLIRYQGSVLNPFLMAAGVLRRSWVLALAGTVGQAALFSATGYKLFYFAIPAALGVAFALRRGRSLTGLAVTAGVTMASLVAILADHIRGGPLLWVEIFIDRMLVVPGMLTAAYVWVYDDRPKHLWTYSIINPIGPETYHGEPPGIVVGILFSGSRNANANANFMADGYANLGWTGLAIESLVVVAILWWLNATGRHLPIALTAPMLLIPALTLANGSAFTALTTGGVVFAGLLMACLPADGWGPVERHRPGRRSVAIQRSTMRRVTSHATASTGSAHSTIR